MANNRRKVRNRGVTVFVNRKRLLFVEVFYCLIDAYSGVHAILLGKGDLLFWGFSYDKMNPIFYLHIKVS